MSVEQRKNQINHLNVLECEIAGIPNERGCSDVTSTTTASVCSSSALSSWPPSSFNVVPSCTIASSKNERFRVLFTVWNLQIENVKANGCANGHCF